MVNFSNEMKLDLIELVYEQRDLWDPTSPDVRSKNKREQIWKIIGKHMKKKNESCKEEWVKLRKSYDRYKKTDVTNRRPSQNDMFFKLMTFLDIRKQQGNTNQQQSYVNQQQSNVNQQRSYVNQQQSNVNQQRSYVNQQQSYVNQQQSYVNQQQSNVNQQRSYVNQQQRNETQQTSNGNQPKGIEHNFYSGNNSGTQNLLPEARSRQYAQQAVQSLHVNVNVGSNTHESTQPFCKNTPVARPKPKVAQKQRPRGNRTNNIKKNTINKKKKTCATMADELDGFCRHVRSTLGILPRDLQIKAQDELFQILSKFKIEALASKRASGSTSNATSTDTSSSTLRQDLTASENVLSIAERLFSNLPSYEFV